MARRPALIKKSKPKPVKLGKKAVASLNIGFYGNEPSKNDPRPWKNREAYNWYSFNCDEQTAKDFLLEYLQENNRIEHKIISSIDEKIVYGYGSTICWMVRLAGRGFDVFDETMFNDRLSTIIRRNKEIQAEKAENKPRRAANSNDVAALKARDKLSDIIGYIDEKIDNLEYTSISQFLTTESVSKSFIPSIVAYYKPYIDEIFEVLNKPTDPQIIEYYSKFKVSALKAKLAFLNSIVNDCNAYIEVKKVERKPRKKKVITVEKKLAHFKYQKDDIALGLKSIDPTKVIGAKELWVYNTKYGLLQHYIASNDTGLDVKGTTLLNYSGTSCSKRVGRYAGKYTQEVLTGGKIALRKIMESIKTAEVASNGRIGENSILLKAITT